MKKIIFTFVFLTLFLILSITSVSPYQVSAGETVFWDGSVASSFESGCGTKNDPYIIRTPSQLAYLSKTVSGGNSYEGEYIKLISDISMNDESFEFRLDSGLVKITDGTNKIYIGTGIKERSSDVFATTASELGRFYESEISKTQGIYAGNINNFTPIGNVEYTFSGIFDGGHHSISGLYIKSASLSRVGLFGNIYEASVKNLSLKNSCILGTSHVGSIVGEASFSAIENCYSAAVVCGSENVGGISGNLVDTKISSCYNIGTVIGNRLVGGIAGISDGEIYNTYNTGNIYANKSAGGIVGKNNGSINESYNAGKVFAGQSAGAVSGDGSGRLTNVYYIAGSVEGDTYGLTDIQMKNKESFSGFDFDKTWEMGVAGDYNYPTLISIKHKNASHSYDNPCDNICNICGHVRNVSHSYEASWSRSEEHHFYKCTVCGDESEKSAHVYDDACDSICNVCEYNRNVFHKYDTLWSYDKGSHWHECLACGDKKDVAAHTPGKDATATAPQVCKVCQYIIKAPTGHTHSFESSWKYDEETHYKKCSCGEKEFSAVHEWNGGEITTAPTEISEGVKTYMCTVCSAKKTEKIDKLQAENNTPPSFEDDKNNSDENDGSDNRTDNYDTGTESKEANSNTGIALSIASLAVSLINLILFAVIIIILLKNKNEKKA